MDWEVICELLIDRRLTPISQKLGLKSFTLSKLVTEHGILGCGNVVSWKSVKVDDDCKLRVTFFLRFSIVLDVCELAGMRVVQ